MTQEITIPQLKEKVVKTQEDIANLLYELQKETGISINGISVFTKHTEVARDQHLILKIEYDI